MEEKKKSRFIIEKDDIEIVGRRKPTDEDLKEADEAFDKLLKDRKPKK